MDSDDSDSEVEDPENPWQLQQNWNEGGNTVDDHDSHDDTVYELEQQHQQMLLQGLQAYLMNLERSRQELKASTLTAQQQKQLLWAELFWAALQPEMARATSTQATSTQATTI